MGSCSARLSAKQASTGSIRFAVEQKLKLSRTLYQSSCSITASAVSIAEKTTQYVSHCDRSLIMNASGN